MLRHVPLDEMLRLFKEKFSQHEIFHVVKSLTYFDDAEQYADPVLFDKQVTWASVKSEIRKVVKNLG